MSDRLTIRGKKGKGGGGGGRTAKEAPNTLQSKAIARVVDLVSEGDILGLVNGARSVYLNKTPLQNEDGSYNFDGIVFHERLGTPDQDPIPGFTASESEVVLGSGSGIEVANASPVVRQITDNTLDSVRVTLRWNALTKQNKDNGDLNGNSVDYRISVQPSGGVYQTVVDSTVSGKTVSPYERAYRVPLNGSGPWNIRVERLSADDPDSASQSSMFWARYTELVESKLIYPDSACYGIAVDAEQFGGSVPERAYDIYGRIVQVPANYNPETRTYATTGTGTTGGMWDGTFKLAWSDNPAWVLYDILTNNRYGVGDLIETSLIDKWGLYEVSRWCDELVDDGYGGQEPRFTFNGVIQGREDAFNVIQSIASTFRGITYYSQGAVVARADRPEDPVKLVTPANVINGEFKYSGTALKARHSAAIIYWNDPSDFYRQIPEVVEDPDAIQRYGWRPVELTAFACNRRGQARRLGLDTLYTEQNQTQTVSYRAGLDHADLFPGDLIEIQDPNYAGVRMGGRVASYDAGSGQIVLDSPIPMQTGETYSLAVVMPDGTIETHSLTTTAGDQATFTVSFGQEPQPGAVWICTASNLAPRQFRVNSVRETEPHIFEVTALEHAPEKYEYLARGILFDQAPTFTDGRNAPPPPTNVNAQESTVYRNGLPHQEVTLSWTAPQVPLIEGYLVRIQEPTGQWRSYGLVAEASTVVRELQEGTWNVEVRTVARGLRSQPATAQFTVSGKGIPPGPPTNLQAQGDFRAIILTWTLPTDNDLAGIEVWEATVDDRSSASLIGTVSGSTYTRTGLAGLEERFYWVRAVDITGNVSEFNSNLGTSATTTQATHDDLVAQIVDESILVPTLLEQIQSAQVNAGELADFYALVDGLDLKVDTYESRVTTLETFQQSIQASDGSQLVIDSQLQLAKDEARTAAVQQVDQAYLGPSGAIAQQVDVVRTEVDDKLAALEIDASTIDGLKAQYTVKIDNNGYISGFGLASDASEGTPTSEFVVLADRFAMVQPNIGGAPEYPFVIGEVNGQSRVSINSAFITEVISAILKSPDNKFRIDLENKFISIEV